MQYISCEIQYICYYICRGGSIVKNKMKIARVQVDLTQEQLAEKVGVTRQTISLIENGKYNPSLKLCLEICYTVNKTLDDIFWIEKEEDQR